MRHLPRNLALGAGLGLALAACDRPVDIGSARRVRRRAQHDRGGARGRRPGGPSRTRVASSPIPAIRWPSPGAVTRWRVWPPGSARMRRTGALQRHPDRRSAARGRGHRPADPCRGTRRRPHPVAGRGGYRQPCRRGDPPRGFADVETSQLEPAKGVGVEPVRHRVERGETAFSIARLYDVPVRTLAEWNGLGSDFSVREGQFLLIPVAPKTPRGPRDRRGGDAARQRLARADTAKRLEPLPEEDTQPASAPTEAVAAPDLGADQSRASAARMVVPVGATSCAITPRAAMTASTSPPTPERPSMPPMPAPWRPSPKIPTACRSS